ncbi:NEK protein kinase [Aphanomyces invadans]|uniref:non-specific serine/threonine protein kinase n=1 Tax=Aphanomyces invadans TaxID=157072 RepID=A0A024TAP1_9STRA|nr:NEK protein kinase [Aphanomyces invadans]ETV90686.1 NEK protein kinase [Aphanomyces invadans]|eukprot:XP_008880683.1 NEK protein kinase [Aphanomyces invadans]
MNPSDVHVLVVEDDEFTRMATIDILRSIGYVITAVDNGGDALKKLTDEPNRFDLVLCDVMLPVLTGIQLLECVQKEVSLSHIPIVMASSNEEMDVVTSCLSKGAKDYLIKPIQYNTAKTLVRHVWLSRKSNNTDSGASRVSTNTNSNAANIWRDLEVLRTIGKGTHGTVVLARRRGDGAVVAVKRVRLATTSENGRKQADNEVILLKSLYHVNIVRFYDSFIVDNDELNIVMEFSDGGNLRQVVKLRARKDGTYFPEPLIMSWFAQLVLAVSYIHGKNVLHRDLKAQNVFLTKKYVVKLGDFGISKALSGDDLAMTSVGTPESMSPEICRGERYGKKSDIWSLGCVLYEMTMLKRPFEAQSLPEMFTKICHGEYEPVPSNAFSKELRLLVQLMLQQDPSKRPSIEDICRFPFVQAPIQVFLSDHAAEFELALQTEAKMNQAPQPNGMNSVVQHAVEQPPTPPTSIRDHDMESPMNHSDSLREMAISSQVVGLDIHKPTPFELLSRSFDRVVPTEEDSLSLSDRLRCLVTPREIKVNFYSSYPMVVTGQDLVQAFQANYAKQHPADRLNNETLLDLAYNAIHELLQQHSLHLVYGNSPLGSVDNLFRFQIDTRDGSPLNTRYLAPTNTASTDQPLELCLHARAMAAELHSNPKFPAGIHLHWNLSKPAADTSCRQYRQFLQTVSAFQTVGISKLTSKDRQVFFINIYNTMVLHGLIEVGLPQTSDQYKSFERDIAYRIDGMDFSLSDIRHGILRCNRKPPSAFWGRQFEAQDPRLAYCFHTRDPRSLLVLLEQSPPFTKPEDAPILKPRQTDTDLERYMRLFCQKQVQVEAATKTLRLPRILRVYQDDFGSSESELIGWLAQYMDECPRDIMQYRIRYLYGIAV